ncbi:MAG: helix-turn-helix transcriptional regulator [Pseudomonadota bacterium]
MLDSALSWLFLLAIGQAGFLVLGLLGTRQREVRSANRLLACLLLVCVAIIGHAWLGLHGLYASYPHSANAIVTLGLLVGPLLYLYLRGMLFERALVRRDLLHFLPFALATLALLPFYLQSADLKLAWLQQRTALPWYLVLAALGKTVLFYLYIVATYRLMQRASASPLALGLSRLMKVWLLGGTVSLAALGIEFAEIELPVSADAVGAIALMIFVYATAFLAIRLPLSYRPMPEPAPPPKARYANTALSEQARSSFLQELNHAMDQDQVFRNGELKLEELAALTAMTPHELSQLINEVCGANFQEYLNRRRVEALKEALHAPAHGADSILDLGLMCGFNSKTALNRAFKNVTGQTPSEYRKQVFPG